MSREGAALAAVVLGLCAGCESLPEEDLLVPLQPHYARLVAEPSGEQVSAVVLRLTEERALLALPRRRPGLALAEPRVAVRLLSQGEPCLAEVPRAPEMLPVQPAHEPRRLRAGTPLFAFGAGPPAPGVIEAVDEDGVRVELAESRLDQEGAWVLDAEGRLLGRLRLDEEGARLLPLDSWRDALWQQLATLPGADSQGPDDAFLLFRVALEESPAAEALPRIADDWGGPDLFLALDRGELDLARLELTPGRELEGERLIALAARTPLEARVVERDLSILAGETEELVAGPVQLKLDARRAQLTFRLSDAVLAAHPEAAGGARELELRLHVSELDPERASGPDRTPLGAPAQPLGRVASGTVDLRGGDASDLWSFQLDAPGELFLVFMRHRPRSHTGVQAFGLGNGTPLWTADPAGTGRFILARVDAPGRSLLLRVRQHAGHGPARYSLLVVPREADPTRLVRAFFRVVTQAAATRRTPYLGSAEFAREVAVALSGEGGYPREALGLAVLDSLGHRILEARHLALLLLERHLPPPQEALEAAHRIDAASAQLDREHPHRALDAGLLLVNRDLRREGGAELVLRAALDADDPRIRARAVHCARRMGDPRLLRQLQRALAQDPAPIVRRALALSLLSVGRRARRPAGQPGPR